MGYDCWDPSRTVLFLLAAIACFGGCKAKNVNRWTCEKDSGMFAEEWVEDSVLKAMFWYALSESVGGRCKGM